MEQTSTENKPAGVKEWAKQIEAEIIEENILTLNEVSDHILSLVQAIACLTKEHRKLGGETPTEDPTSETAYILANLRDIKTQFRNDLAELAN